MVQRYGVTSADSGKMTLPGVPYNNNIIYEGEENNGEKMVTAAVAHNLLKGLEEEIMKPQIALDTFNQSEVFEVEVHDCI